MKDGANENKMVDTLYCNTVGVWVRNEEQGLIARVENLKFCYAGAGQPVLDIPAWSVQAGEQVFLHGPSGSGKSTLLNLLAGILLPSSGTVTILDKPLGALRGGQRDKWRARHIGVVFQQFNLIPYLNAVDNIKLAAHFAGAQPKLERVLSLLNSLGINESVRLLAASKLSIGQQQRVAIARAMINQPELLIVDEPTSALDQKNRDAFMRLLLEQVTQNHTALIFVSHDLSLAKTFSRVEALAEINRVQGVA